MHPVLHLPVFPTHEIEIPAGSDKDYWLVNGDVIASNPSMCAISEASVVACQALSIVDPGK